MCFSPHRHFRCFTLLIGGVGAVLAGHSLSPLPVSAACACPLTAHATFRHGRAQRRVPGAVCVFCAAPPVLCAALGGRLQVLRRTSALAQVLPIRRMAYFARRSWPDSAARVVRQQAFPLSNACTDGVQMRGALCICACVKDWLSGQPCVRVSRTHDASALIPSFARLPTVFTARACRCDAACGSAGASAAAHCARGAASPLFRCHARRRFEEEEASGARGAVTRAAYAEGASAGADAASAAAGGAYCKPLSAPACCGARHAAAAFLCARRTAAAARGGADLQRGGASAGGERPVRAGLASAAGATH
jgi:hypothetical protein